MFLIIWLGQLVSTIGSGLTGFALGIWVLQTTGSATQYAIIFLCASLPKILASPLAGALADRWDRRKVMILSDLGAGLGTAVIAVLFFSGTIQIWHIYVVNAISSFFNAFQWPAYTAATTMLVPKEQLGRASGLSQTSYALAEILAPAIAGVMVVTIGVGGVVVIDFVTALIAITTLLLVRIPRPPESAEGASAKGPLRREIAFGWTYIKERPGLLGLLILFAITNFGMRTVVVLFTPYLFSLTSPELVGVIYSISGFGMLLGAVLMSAWGGPKQRVITIVALMAFEGVLVIVAGFVTHLVVITVGTFLFMLCWPIVNACSQALWQQKVAPDVQGRVFAVRRMIAWSMMPLAYGLAGPLADRFFEPWMAVDGVLASTVGTVLGVGPGRGIALLFVLLGVLTITGVLLLWSRPKVRHLERDLPDAVA